MSSCHRSNCPKSSRKSVVIPISTQDGNGHHPTVQGHVTLNQDENKKGGIDMTLHFALKNKDKEQRSSSRTRRSSSKRPESTEPRSYVVASEGRSRSSKEASLLTRTDLPWRDIMNKAAEQSAPPTSYFMTMQAEREYSHKEETNPSKGHASERKRKVAELPNQGDKSLDFDDGSLRALNPVRTLQFLVKELHSIVKPQRSREVTVFKMIEDVVSRIPGEFSPEGMKRHPLEVASEPNKQSRPEVSIAKYELLRKDRDDLYQKLEEKSKSHLALERKLAASEAKLVRLSSEFEELKDRNKQMVKDQKRLLDSVASVHKYQGNRELEGRLENELTAAKTYIGGLEKSVGSMREKFSQKMRTIQDVLNNGLDHYVQENPRITDIIGLSPFDVEPLEYPNDSIQAPANLAPISVAEELNISSSSVTSINAQKYINKVMMNSGLLKPDQEHLFQSFHSMVDQE